MTTTVLDAQNIVRSWATPSAVDGGRPDVGPAGPAPDFQAITARERHGRSSYGTYWNQTYHYFWPCCD